MPGSDIVLGPFTGGLNQVDDPRMVSDNELTVCQNLDIDPNGEIVIRSPLKLLSISPIYSTPGTGPNEHYLVGAGLQPDNNSRLFAYSESDGFLYHSSGPSFGTPYNKQNSWSSITMGQSNKIVQYNGFAWVIPRDPSFTGGTLCQGFKSDLSNANAGAAVTAMPRGSGAVIHKDRLFIFGPQDITNYTPTSRVYYSAATNFDSWPALNFFDINPGDGEGVTAAYATVDSIIFFKRHSIYILTFDTDPGLGTLRRLDSSVGCTGPDAITFYKGNIYFVDDSSIYRVAAYNVVEIGRNLNLKKLRTTNSFTARTQDFAVAMGSRIIFAIWTGTNFPSTGYLYFVYHTEVGAWSQYLLAEQPERFYKVVNNTHTEEVVSSKYDTPKIYRMRPYGLSQTGAYDNIEINPLGDYPDNLLPITLTTKSYNMGTFSNFKRMLWWGAELLFSYDIRLQSWHDDGTFSERSQKDYSFGSSYSSSFFKAPAPGRARYWNFTITTIPGSVAQQPYFKFLSMMMRVLEKAKVYAAGTD